MADRYWVGGTNSWNGTAGSKWATTSGGAGGAAEPTSADDVYFDVNSGAVTVTVNTVTPNCRSLSFTSPSGAFTGTFTGGTNINIYGSFTLVSGMTYTSVGTLQFVSTSAGNTITSAGKTLASLTFDGIGGTWILQDNLTANSAYPTNLINGALDLNNKTLSIGFIVSNNANVRSIAFGTGKIILTNNNTVIWGFQNATNFTYTGTPTVECSYTGSAGNRTFRHGTGGGGTEANAPDINITGGADSLNMAGGYKNLIFTTFTGTFLNVTPTIYGNFTVIAGMTVSAGGVNLSFSGSGTQLVTTNGQTLDFPITKNGSGNLILQDNLTMGSSRAFNLLTGQLNLNDKTFTVGVFGSSAVNVRSIAFGIGNITLTGNATTIFNTASSGNLTYTGTPTFNCTYAGPTGTRTIASGSVIAASSFSFNISAGSDTVSISNGVLSLNFTGFSGTLANNIIYCYGSFTASAGMTFTAGVNALEFNSTSAGNTISSAGKTFNFPLIFNGIGGEWAFQDALTQGSTRAFTFTNGTVQLKNGVTSTVGAFATSGTNQKFLQSTTSGSQATLSQASGTVNASYLTIKDINATGGATWNALWSNNNVDLGNNTGWFFGDQPIINAVEYTYKIRSFTEPRRF